MIHVLLVQLGFVLLQVFTVIGLFVDQLMKSIERYTLVSGSINLKLGGECLLLFFFIPKGYEM